MHKELYITHLLDNLTELKDQLGADFIKEGQINSFYIDNLLPYELAAEIDDAFPDKSDMNLKDSIREQKYVSAQLDKHESIISDIIYAFQDEKIVKIISEIKVLRTLNQTQNYMLVT